MVPPYLMSLKYRLICKSLLVDAKLYPQRTDYDSKIRTVQVNQIQDTMRLEAAGIEISTD
jgi:hypothetical protein